MGFFGSSKKRQDRAKPQISDPIIAYYSTKPLPPIPQQPKKYQAYSVSPKKKPGNVNKPLPKLPKDAAFKGDPMASLGQAASQGKVFKGHNVKSVAGAVYWNHH